MKHESATIVCTSVFMLGLPKLAQLEEYISGAQPSLPGLAAKS